MNLLEHYVLEVIDKPIFKHNHWFVKVLCECYGRQSYTQVMFKTEEEALVVKKDYMFLA